MGDTISVIVNGLEEKVAPGTTLAELIEHCREMDPDLVVEHNGRFVYPKQYPVTTVAANDRVEFIHPHFGG